MDKKKGIIFGAIAVLLIVGGYLVYQSTSNNESSQTQEGIEELTKEDKEIMGDVSKEDVVETTTITRDEGTVVLRIEFAKGTSEEDQAELASKYMDQMMEQYPDENVNVSYSVKED